MTPNPFVVERFGGLRLDIDPSEVGAENAVDLSNVDLDEEGRVRTRDGYSQVKALAMTTPWGFAAFETSSGTRQVVVGYWNGAAYKFEAYASTGGAAVATATPAHAQMYTVRFGTPGNQYLYLANGADRVWRWTGAAFSQPAGMPTALYLAVKPNSNRLVAGFTGGGNSRVEFSDAGAPETWTSTSWVDLTPGDESAISGLATWRDSLFAFKRKRFFVFGQESTGSTGQPVFNYYPVEGYGCTVPPAAGDEGVFFFDGRSVWLTNGNVHREISRAINPFLRGAVPVGGDYISLSDLPSIRLTYALGRLYLSYVNAGGAYKALVYDPKVDMWTQYGLSLHFAAALGTSADQQYVYWLGAAGFNKFDPASLSSDPSYWTSGAYDLSGSNRVAITRESSLWGAGAATLQVANDFGSFDTGSSVQLGAAYPTPPAQGWQQIDREGTFWQHKLSSSFLPFTVSRLAHYVSFVKPAGLC